MRVSDAGPGSWRSGVSSLLKTSVHDRVGLTSLRASIKEVRFHSVNALTDASSLSASNFASYSRYLPETAVEKAPYNDRESSKPVAVRAIIPTICATHRASITPNWPKTSTRHFAFAVLE